MPPPARTGAESSIWKAANAPSDYPRAHLHCYSSLTPYATPCYWLNEAQPVEDRVESQVPLPGT